MYRNNNQNSIFFKGFSSLQLFCNLQEIARNRQLFMLPTIIANFNGMTLQYEIIYNTEINPSHKETFFKLLSLQGKVKGDLLEKAVRCKFICIVTLNSLPIAIGGVKPKTSTDFNKTKADLLSLESAFEWELGYIYTVMEHSGKGVASYLVKVLLNEFGNDNIMASTEITLNPGMVRILEKNNFKQYGNPWKSKIHDNYLGLFLKFK